MCHNMYSYIDAEGCFQALVAILFSIKNAQKSLDIINKMTESICANKTHPKLRLQILVTLFNLVTNVDEKFAIVKGIFMYIYADLTMHAVYNAYTLRYIYARPTLPWSNCTRYSPGYTLKQCNTFNISKILITHSNKPI